jgi:hypothetical protein
MISEKLSQNKPRLSLTNSDGLDEELEPDNGDY